MIYIKTKILFGIGNSINTYFIEVRNLFSERDNFLL